MIHQYRGGVQPKAPEQTGLFGPEARAVVENTLDYYERLDFSKALEEIWKLIASMDRSIVEYAPWKLAKDGERERLDLILYSAAETLRVVTALAKPSSRAKANSRWPALVGSPTG